MPSQKEKPSRRSFIIRSAFAVGAVGTGFYVSRRGYAVGKGKGHPKDFRVRVRYPWYADVNGRGQATMYLLHGTNPGQAMSLGNLLGHERPMGDPFPGWPLVDTSGGQNGVINYMLEHARDLAGLSHTAPGNPAYEEAAAEMTRAMNEDNNGDPFTLANLVARLQAVSDAVHALESDDARRAWTYVEYARRDKYEKADNSGWPNTVRVALLSLDKIISVPLLYTFPGDVRTCFRVPTYAMRNRTLAHLFTWKHNNSNFGSGEVAHWKLLRDMGLLWCQPQVLDQNCTRPNYRYHTLDTGNSMRCVDGECEPGNEDEYCQEVDGTCNAMS